MRFAHRIGVSLCVIFVMAMLFKPLHAHEVGREMAAAAEQWLNSLSAEQRQSAVFPFADDERENWHYVPKSRKGLPFKQMNDRQRGLAKNLIRSAMSEQGHALIDNIVALEQVLFELEKSPRRDAELYYFSVFGEPGAPHWGWRMEGHHLSINLAIVAGHVAVTPTFFGANPGEVKTGSQQGKKTMAKEEEWGRALARSMTTAQRKTAFFAEQAPAEIVTEAKRSVEPGQDFGGIAVADLTDAQRREFVRLLELYAHRFRKELATQELQEIMQPGWERNVRFAWAGGLEPGQGHYYRLHGPTFLIEYDNTQNNANHIHTVWRDFNGDFGRDLLREHYDESHGK